MWSKIGWKQCLSSFFIWLYERQNCLESDLYGSTQVESHICRAMSDMYTVYARSKNCPCVPPRTRAIKIIKLISQSMGVYCVKIAHKVNPYPFWLQLAYFGHAFFKIKSSHGQCVTGYKFWFYFPNKTSIYLIFSYFSVIYVSFEVLSTAFFFLLNLVLFFKTDSFHCIIVL